MANEDEGDLIEMRCRSCGSYLGVRRRQGPFIFWCSEPCANTPMAKFPTDQVRDEVAVTLPRPRRPEVMRDPIFQELTTNVRDLVQQHSRRRG